jgi:proline dehydrogenase
LTPSTESRDPSAGGQPTTPDTSPLASLAALALKRISRDERIKSYVQNERPVYDALLGATLRFIGGERLEECLETARRLNAAGHAVTIDYMGESTRSERLAAQATEEFVRVVRAVSSLGLDASVSLDLSHLGLVVGHDLALENASLVAREADGAGLELMISMEGAERTHDVLRMYHDLAAQFPRVGITLAAYLHRTPDDLERVLQRPGKVRLVKGAFGEPTSEALGRGQPLNEVYRTLAERLLLARHPVSIATHDPDLLDHVHRFVQDHTPNIEHIEFEMLYGVQPERLDEMRRLGYRTRVYLPYGEEWYLYLCHRIAEHPPNLYQAMANAVARAYVS